ncbi:MAG: Mu-like prophage major head subunit gpT family protein [Pseudomonadota bacterium]
MIINQTNLATLNTGYKAAFNQGFKSASPVWPKIAEAVTSTTSTALYAWLGTWPGLREWVGDRQVENLTRYDYAITNKQFESTVAVKQTDIEDDQYGVYAPMMKAMGTAAANHPDQLVFNLLKDGFTTKCYDGQYFFDSDHPVGGTSVSNVQPGSNPAWFLLDTTQSLKPLILQKRKDYKFTAITKPDSEAVFFRGEIIYGVDGRCNVGFGFWQQAFGSKDELTRENFRAAYSAMRSFRSDQGVPLNISPNLLVVPPQLYATARDLILAERDDKGATNTDRNLVQIIETGWLV